MTIVEALELADQFGSDGHNQTPTGQDEWNTTLDALCLLAAAYRDLVITYAIDTHFLRS